MCCFLDEAHTRGTDLKMGIQARGALTLGIGQTKDHTVQAALRLRQLGSTQSLVFFAPPEVHSSILDCRKKSPKAELTSVDVVHWLLEMTASSIEQLEPLYYNQGLEFCRRIQAARDNTDFLTDPAQRNRYLKVLRQPERQTLEELYLPKARTPPTQASEFSSPDLAAFMIELNTRRARFQDSGTAIQNAALQEIEQEREQEREIEVIREVRRPIFYLPLKFEGLHPEIAVRTPLLTMYDPYILGCLLISTT